MAIQPSDASDVRVAVPMNEPLTREERCDQYRTLARAILELAWRDANPNAACGDADRRQARAFVFSEDADFWARVAGVNLAQIRKQLRRHDELSER